LNPDIIGVQAIFYLGMQVNSIEVDISTKKIYVIIIEIYFLKGE